MITVVGYDPAWPDRFTAERAALVQVLGPWLTGGVHHVGSTAVPGLAAKPILDMLAGVGGLGAAAAAVTVLAGLGYAHAPHRPDALWFHRDTDGAHTHQVHLTGPGSALWRERPAFRDALRADPALAADYADLKRGPAERHADALTPSATIAAPPLTHPFRSPRSRCNSCVTYGTAA